MRGNLLSDSTYSFIAAAGDEQKALGAHLISACHLDSSLSTDNIFISVPLKHSSLSEFPPSLSSGGVWVRSAQWFSDLMLRELIQLLFEETCPKTRLSILR